MEPKSVAVVGASESSPRHAVRALLDSDLEVHLVNPRHDRVFGRRAHPTLASIGQPVDAVLTLVNARAAVSTVAEAAEIGAGGVAVNAAGFAETGPAGAALQRALADAAGTMPVLGPNCNGFVNARTGAFLAGAPKLPLRAGTIGVVTHSGGFITDLAVAAVDRQIGFSSLISTGNEVVTDMVDYLEYLTDDPATAAVGLVVESLRRPADFFRAVDRALASGKPVVALKLGRSSRGQEVAASHTGAVVGEGWVYDAAFRQAGVITARDLADLLDRLSLFAQLPPSRWSAARNVALVTVSGGSATLASDICHDEGVSLPELSDLKEPLAELLPQAGGTNPNDLTGFAMTRPDLVEAMLKTYTASDGVDALVGLWTLGLETRGFADAFVLPFAAAAMTTTKPVVLAAVADARVSAWATQLGAGRVAVGHGLRGTVRGLAAMSDFARFQRRSVNAVPEDPPAAVPPPPADDRLPTPSGEVLRFAAAMELLQRHGFRVAPYVVLTQDDEPVVPGHIRAPYVVKLAECPHRTDIGAVHVGVAPEQLAGAVRSLRRLATAHDLPTDVAVQPLLPSAAELFVGGQVDSGLGPMIVAGLGGVHVEKLGGLSGRIAPFGAAAAHELIAETDRLGQFEGVRGADPLDRQEFASILTATSRLVAGATNWMVSLDVNPVLATPDGFVAVDALVYVRPPDRD